MALMPLKDNKVVIMQKIKSLVENNLSILLLIGFLLGFVAPDMGNLADEIAIILTAALIFLSCADIKPVDFLKIDVFQVALFTMLRFAIFPLLCFFVIKELYPEFAVGTLLLLLMPAGVAVASLCSMTGAKVALGLSLTIISSLLAPAFIPGVFAFLGQYVAVDIFQLFLTLLLVVFVPIGLYFFGAARVPQIDNALKSYNKSAAVVILAIILMVVIAAQKQEFLNNIGLIFTGFWVMVVIIGLCWGFGIAFSYFVDKGDKIPFVISSGAMNNSLAVGLAFAYFDPVTSLFIVLSEVVWSIYVALAQWFFSKRA